MQNVVTISLQELSGGSGAEVSQFKRELKRALTESLNEWQTLDNNRIDLSSLPKRLSGEEQNSLNEWLHRLQRTGDFSANRQRVANTVCSMLRTVQSEAPFRAIFFAQVNRNLAGPEEEAAMALDEIMAAWEIYKTQAASRSSDESPFQFTGVARSLSKTREVHAERARRDVMTRQLYDR